MKQVLYFSAPWCAPCKSFAPQFRQVVDAHEDVDFLKIDIDEQFEKARSYGVRGIPCIVVMDGEKEVGRIASGAVTKANLEKLLD